MRAVLFTKFPIPFIKDNIVPALRDRGIEVVEVLDPDRRRSLPSGDYELVLYMHEMSSHGMWEAVRKAAKADGKKFSTLERKVASWPDTLRGTPPAPPADVRPPHEKYLDAMLRKVAAAREKDEDYDAIVKQLAQFYPTRTRQHAPTTGAQLVNLLSTIRADAACPEWFHAWSRGGTPNVGIAAAVKMAERGTFVVPSAGGEIRECPPLPPPPPPAPEPPFKEPRDGHALLVPEPPQERAAEDAELARLYEQDNARLTKELAALKLSLVEETRKLGASRMECGDTHRRLEQSVATIASLTEQLNAANARIAQLDARPVLKSANRLGAMLTKIRPLVPEILSGEEALDKLVTYAEKHYPKEES